MTNIFGPLVTAADLNTAITDHLRLWTPTYLAEIERHTGRDAMVMPPFRSYVDSVDTNWDNEDQLPACVVVVPGLADVPYRDGEGSHDADWIVHLAAVVSATNRQTTDVLAKLYTAMLRMLMVQQGSIGGFAERSRWQDERYDELTFDEGRTLSMGVVTFNVTVKSTVVSTYGPVMVPDDPYADPGQWATVGDEKVYVGVEKLS